MAAASLTPALAETETDPDARLPTSNGDVFGALSPHGLIEVEAFAGEAFDGSESSGFELATLELGVTAPLNDTVSTRVRMHYEEGTPEDIEIDEAVLVLAPSNSGWSATLGRNYTPFGTYETALIADPLPLELGETREATAQIDYRASPWRLATWAFNGPSNDGGDDTIEHAGLHASVDGSVGGVDLDASASWVNSIADSDSLAASTVGVRRLDDYVPGAATSLRLARDPITVNAEYLAATETFAADELAFNGGGARPAAWQLEVACDFRLAGLPATAAASVQGTREALGLGLPDRRALIGATVRPWSATTVALQWAHDEDYSRNDGGTGEAANTVTAQIAVGF